MITVQDERLHKRQRFIEEKAAELALFEEKLQKESEAHVNLQERIQQERLSVQALQSELNDKMERQKEKQQVLVNEEQRLASAEREIESKTHECQKDQQKIRTLAVELQTRHEEVMKRRKDLDARERQCSDREKQCDEYELRLRDWEAKLESVTELLQQGGEPQEIKTNDQNR